MKTGIGSTIAVGLLTALTLGGLTPSPARADDYRETQNAIRHDIRSIHHDEARIKGLTHKWNDQLRHRDWRHARGTEERLGYARMDLQRDRALLRADQRAFARLARL